VKKKVGEFATEKKKTKSFVLRNPRKNRGGGGQYKKEKSMVRPDESQESLDSNFREENRPRGERGKHLRTEACCRIKGDCGKAGRSKDPHSILESRDLQVEPHFWPLRGSGKGAGRETSPARSPKAGGEGSTTSNPNSTRTRPNAGGMKNGENGWKKRGLGKKKTGEVSIVTYTQTAKNRRQRGERSRKRGLANSRN